MTTIGELVRVRWWGVASKGFVGRRKRKVGNAGEKSKDIGMRDDLQVCNTDTVWVVSKIFMR